MNYIEEKVVKMKSKARRKEYLDKIQERTQNDIGNVLWALDMNHPESYGWLLGEQVTQDDLYALEEELDTINALYIYTE